MGKNGSLQVHPSINLTPALQKGAKTIPQFSHQFKTNKPFTNCGA